MSLIPWRKWQAGLRGNDFKATQTLTQHIANSVPPPVTSVPLTLNNLILDTLRVKNRLRIPYGADKFAYEGGIQDFTQVNENDPNSHITITSADRITFSGLHNNEIANAYYDLGVGYFDGDFTLKCTFELTSSTWAPPQDESVIPVAFTNLISPLSTIDAASGDALFLYPYRRDATTYNCLLYELDGGTLYASNIIVLTKGTTYYLTIVRDESASSFGTAYCYIYTDFGRVTAVGTLTRTLHSKVDFRYLFPINTWYTAGETDTADGFIEHLKYRNDKNAGALWIEGINLHLIDGTGEERIVLNQDDIDDAPVNDQQLAPISSNWAFDHVAAADPHGGYILESLMGTYAVISSVGSGTPTNLNVTEQTVVGRITGGSISALSQQQLATLVTNYAPVYKSYNVTTQGLGVAPTIYAGGFYEAPVTDANLNQAGPTVTYGAANRATAAHAFLVAGTAGATDGGTVSVVVSGISINDQGTSSAGDSETIVSDVTTMATNDYFETTKKWLGQITYTLTVGGSASTYNADFNYGFAKYEDFGNKDFTVMEMEAVGYAGANENDFNIELCHHQDTGWIYDSTAFSPGPTAIVSLAGDYGTDDQLDSGQHFAYKRDNLSTAVAGSGMEGIIFRITTTANNAVEYANIHVGVQYD